MSDKDLFESLPTGDLWLDGHMHKVWKYIYRCKYVCVPNSWQSVMKAFDEEVSKAVARQQTKCHIC